MAVDTYKWPCQIGGGQIQYKQTVRSAGFGDGYVQAAEQGINSTAITIPLIHTGFNAEVDAVRAFLLAHTVKAFIITPPGEAKGLFRVDPESITKDVLSSNMSTISFTIKRAYGVYA